MNLEQTFSINDEPAGTENSTRNKAHRKRVLFSVPSTQSCLPQETKLCKELIPDFTLTSWADVTVVSTLKVAQCARNELRMRQECEKEQQQ